MSRKNKLALSGFILVLAAGLAGCGRSAQSYVKLGDDYYQKSKYDDASINYRKALQKDARSGDAYFGLGRALMKQGNANEAYTNLTRAEQLLPSRDDVKVELGDFALGVYLFDPQHPQKLYDNVSRISGDLLAKNPRSFDGLRFAGDIALSDRKFAEAANDMEKANAVRPMEPTVVGPWVEALFQTGQPERAEKLALALIDRHKDFGPIYDVLYNRYMAANRVADAEKLLNTKVANNPGNKVDVLQLARHYAGLQKSAEWTATLKKLLDDPKAFPTAHADVGDLYASRKEWDQALEQYNEGMRAHPEDKNSYQKRIVNVLLSQQKRAEALALLDQMVQADPKDLTSRALRADLWLQSGDSAQLDKAISEFSAVVKERPRDEGLVFTLGRAYLAKKDLNSAHTQFLEAAKLDTRAVPPRVYLAEVALRRQDNPEALRYSDEALAIDPKFGLARLWHASSLIGLGNYAQAERELDSLAKDYPNWEDVQLRMALLRMDQKRYKEATEIFTRLNRPEAGDVRVTEGLAEVAAAQNQLDSAISSLQRELQKSPGSVQLHTLLASLAARGHKADLAIEENQWLLNRDSKNASAYQHLAEAYHMKGDDRQAIDAAQKASDLAKSDPNVLQSAAYIKLVCGRTDEAVGDYRRLLTLEPNEPSALNNLAFLLADRGRDLDEAMTLAVRAANKDPKNPDFKDTLAWVYVKKNLNDTAIEVLKNLTNQNPSEAGYHYHLGIAYLQKGDKQNAKSELGKALAQKPSSDIADKIKEAMAKIG